MIGLLNERRDGNFGLLKLSRAFKFAIQQAMSKAFDMPIPFETAAGAWHTNINSFLTMKPRESFGFMVFTSSICVGRRDAMLELAFYARSLSRAFAQSPGNFLLRVELAPPPRQLVGA
jgi:hypothetical protein